MSGIFAEQSSQGFLTALLKKEHNKLSSYLIHNNLFKALLEKPKCKKLEYLLAFYMIFFHQNKKLFLVFVK